MNYKEGSKLNVAVVGGGFISQIAHLKNLKEIDHVNLIGLAELRPKQAELVANKFSISNIYKSHLELIKECKPDLVYVITRRHHTGPIALDLINAGLNVFTEKPMAQTYEKSKLLVDAAKKIMFFITLVLCADTTPVLERLKLFLTDY